MTTTLDKYYSADHVDSYYATVYELDMGIRILKERTAKTASSARLGHLISNGTRELYKKECRTVSRLTELARTGETTIGRAMIWPDLAPVHVSTDDLYILSSTFMSATLVYKEDENTLIGIDGTVYHKCDICGEWTPSYLSHEFAGLYYCDKLGCEDAAMPNYYDAKTLAVFPEMFAQRQERLNDEAMTYQFYASTTSMNYADLAAASEYFTRLGKKYDLLAEFQENGIC